MARTTDLPPSDSSLDAWRQEVEAGLKGAPFEKRLVTRTVDGLRIEPLFTDRVENPSELPTRAQQRWGRHEELDLSAPSDLGGAVESAIARGIDGLRLGAVTEDQHRDLLKHIDGRPLSLHPTGGADWDSGTRQLSTLVSACAGAGVPQQVGIALARGIDALRAGQAAGQSLSTICGKLEFEIAVDTDLFLCIASLRALRWTWARAVAAAGGSASDQVVRIHGNNSARSWTVRDPWVNLLRGTTGSFAAAIGGADSISTRPFDNAVGQSDPSARRLASNTQALLDEESLLSAVGDPAAGSGYLEQLTEEVARFAWEFVRSCEQRGGAASSEAAEWIAMQIAERSQLEAQAVASRRQAIVGVSEFPNLGEEPLERASASNQSSVVGLAAPFEALRARTESWGKPPQAFLANLGPQAEFRPRALFATNFLAVAGIDAQENEGFADMSSALQAYRDSGAPLAVICSSDERYLECAESFARELTSAGALVLLAGNPRDHLETWSKAGVTEFIHLGCDALGILTRLIQRLEVSA